MTGLCVPFKGSQPDSGYVLYSVDFTGCPEAKIWNVKTVQNYNHLILDKFFRLQAYYEKRYYNQSYPAEFEMKTLDGRKHINVLNEDTQSVFLGLFLKAAEKVQRREFKERWQIICVTGNLDFDESGGSLKLVPVGEIEKKYHGEFCTLAEENSQEEYLFLYISDSAEIPEGEKYGRHSNITVKRFSADSQIEDIIDFIFKPFSFKFDLNDLDSRQTVLLKNMEKEHGIDYGYIPGAGFLELERVMLNDKTWGGFFIYGEGGSGKSAMAMALARYLLCTGKIYAPVWIKLDNEKIIDLIEKESAKGISIFETEQQSKAIYEGIESGNGDLEKELSEKKYLIIFDNLELSENDIIFFLHTVQQKFLKLPNRPYIIITSRTKCDDARSIERLQLREERVPQMNEEQIELFIGRIADQKGSVYAGKIRDAEKNNSLKSLANIIFHKLRDYPDMIITAIGLLQYITVTELCDEINTKLGANEPRIRNKWINIYSSLFSYLAVMEKQLLYFFLEKGDDSLLSLDEIYQEINRSVKWKNTPVNKTILTESLRVLLNYNLIYSGSRENITVYGIKSIPYHTFLFESDFSGPKTETGVSLRDIFIDPCLQLEKALRTDQGRDIIEPLLKKVSLKNPQAKNNYLFLAAMHITSHDIFSLLVEFGCDVNERNKLGQNMFFYAVYAANITALNWLFSFKPGLLDSKDNNEATVYYFAAKSNNTGVLDWLFKHAPELLGCKNKFDFTEFHCAAAYGNPEVLNWFLKHSQDLLYCKDVYGLSVFHYAAKYNNAEALDWFLEHTPELFSSKTKDGLTAFQCAAESNNSAALDWFAQNAPELII